MEGEQTYSMPQAIEFVWEQDGDYVRIDEWCAQLRKSTEEFLNHYGTQVAFQRFQSVMKEELFKEVVVPENNDDLPPLDEDSAPELIPLSEDELNAPDGWTIDECEGDEGDEGEFESDEATENTETQPSEETTTQPTTKKTYVHKYVLPIVLMYLKNTELGVLTDKMCPSHLIISCKANSLHIRVYDGWFNATLLASSMKRDLNLFVQNELPKYETLGQLTQEMGMVRGSIEKDLWFAPSMFFPFLAWCDPVVFADFTGRYLLTGVKHPNTDVFRAMLDTEM